MKITLRTKLNISFLAVIIICGVVAALVGIRLIFTGGINQAQNSVKNDLNSAREIYQQETERIKNAIRFTSLRFFIRDKILSHDIETLIKELNEIRKTESLDILVLTDSNGQVIARSQNQFVFGDSQKNDPFVSRVIENNETISGTIILSEQELAKEGNALVKQAYIEVASTQKAMSKSEITQNSAICMKAASAILDYDNKLIGVLYGGKLVNRNSWLVDKIKQTTYQNIKHKKIDIGVSTIFQENIRVATNVLNKNGQRAIGTEMSKEVYEQVVKKSSLWIHRAFVVDEWYITAYEPIKDISGKTVGALAVGVQERQFIDKRNQAAGIFLGITLAGMIMAMIISNLLAKGILRPIKALTSASDEWAKGNLDYRVDITQTDEISQLADTFNQMAFSLKDRDHKLKEHTNQQIMKSERLATLGQLAAGVAHEINNPLGAILMYAHLSLEDMEDKNILHKNLEKTISEASRCRDIVKGLLDFSRQTEPKVELANINDILERTLAVTKDQALFRNINIEKKLCTSLPKMLVDIGQMQQVFANVILNAGDAMDGNGQLTVTTSISPDNNHIQIEFSDTGHGIDPENIQKIFEPFFTTKDVGKGTGLGLAVSYGIITRHQGTIDVESSPGNGSVFTISLPIKKKVN